MYFVIQLIYSNSRMLEAETCNLLRLQLSGVKSEAPSLLLYETPARAGFQQIKNLSSK